MVITHFQFRTILLIVLLVTLKPYRTVSENTNNYQPRLDEFMQFGLHPESSEPKKQIYFPEGAKLTLNPMLEVPIVNPDIVGVGSKFQLAFPVEVFFDKIQGYPFDLFNGNGRELWFSEKNSVHGRHKRSFLPKSNDSLSTSNLLCLSGGTDRISIFNKLESFWNSYYYPVFGSKRSKGKACLLRAICEVHEYPMECVYGALGEVAKLILSASDIKNSCDTGTAAETIKLSDKLSKYAMAERDGKNRRCLKYTKSCETSLFV